MARKSGKGVTLIVTGVKEVDRALRKLGPAVQKKVVRSAMRKGMALVTAQAKANAPVKTGALRKAIKTRGASKAKKGVIQVETRVGAGDFKGETFYGGMVEFGTSRAPAHPYMTPAYESEKDAARKTAIDAILAGVEREAKGLKAKGGKAGAGAAKAKAAKARKSKAKAKARIKAAKVKARAKAKAAKVKARKSKARPRKTGGLGAGRDAQGRFIKRGG